MTPDILSVYLPPVEIEVCLGLSFIAATVTFLMLCHWLWKERKRTKGLEATVKRQQADFPAVKGGVMSGDDLPAGFLIISPDLKVRFVNEVYLQYTLQRPEDVLGWNIQEVILAEGVEKLAESLLQHPDPAASCCLNASIRVGPAAEWPVHITMARIAPQQREDRVLVVVEEFPVNSVLWSLPVEGYVC